MIDQKKIILYPNAQRDVGFVTARRVNEMLKKNAKRVVLCPAFDNEATRFVPPPDIETAMINDELKSAEMIITFGGDGTVLRAARAAADTETPILGINLGGKGFLAELEFGDIALIEKAVTSGYDIENRMMLDIELLRDGMAISRNFALNDVVIKGDNKVIELILSGDDQVISHFSGDGAVIATPTGSTAYSMAAGGPIVEPAASNIIVTPICAHTLEAKSFVLVSDRCVSVEIGYRKRNPAYMSADGGQHIGILSGDRIDVRKSARCARFVRLSKRNFYEKVSEKLGERP
ncbi:MAG: NAD(+)/NADH kinase [Oscillospiraceae bacterium]|nr:NAD(+)/NADH kinase [Oscillospiraceae bacterium]